MMRTHWDHEKPGVIGDNEVGLVHVRAFRRMVLAVHHSADR